MTVLQNTFKTGKYLSDKQRDKQTGLLGEKIRNVGYRPKKSRKHQIESTMLFHIRIIYQTWYKRFQKYIRATSNSIAAVPIKNDPMHYTLQYHEQPTHLHIPVLNITEHKSLSSQINNWLDLMPNSDVKCTKYMIKS